MEIFTPHVIHAYTRDQAICDGVLVDVTTTAKQAGFTIPVALTQAAWADCVAWTPETQRRKEAYQDEEGRLWDVLFMAARAARANRHTSSCAFHVYRIPANGRSIRPRLQRLKLHIGPGDAGEPVITISLPEED